MKKTILISAAAIILFGSCKKEYTCTCTTTVGNVVTKTTKYTTDKTSKKDAVADCNSKTGVTSYSGVTTNISCVIN
jgi:hypothetical protein